MMFSQFFNLNLLANTSIQNRLTGPCQEQYVRKSANQLANSYRLILAAAALALLTLSALGVALFAVGSSALIAFLATPLGLGGAVMIGTLFLILFLSATCVKYQSNHTLDSHQLAYVFNNNDEI